MDKIISKTQLAHGTAHLPSQKIFRHSTSTYAEKASSLKIFLTALDTKNEGNCFTKLGYQVI